MLTAALTFVVLVPIAVLACALVGQFWLGAALAAVYWLAFRLVRYLLLSVAGTALVLASAARYLFVAQRQFRAGRALRS